MEQYFMEQMRQASDIMAIVETHLGTNTDGSKNIRLEFMTFKRDELSDLNKTYEFVRMSETAMPVLRKISGS